MKKFTKNKNNKPNNNQRFKKKQNMKQKPNKFSKKNNFKINYNKKRNDYEDDITMEQDVQKETINSNFVKVATHWQKETINEPKNTKGNILIDPKNKRMFSMVNNSLCVYSLNNLTKLLEINQENEEIINFVVNFETDEVICATNNSMIRIYNISLKRFTKVWKLNKTLPRIMKIDLFNRFIALGCTNNEILVYSTKNYSLTKSFVSPTFIYDLSFSPKKDDLKIFTAGEDGAVRIWDLLIGNESEFLMGNGQTLKKVTLTNDGKNVIASSIAGNIFIWKLNNKQLLKVIEIGESIESLLYFTRSQTVEDSKTIVPFLLIGTENGYLIDYNLQNDERNQTLILKQAINQADYYESLQALYLLTSDQNLVTINIDLYNVKIHTNINRHYIPLFSQEILDIQPVFKENVENPLFLFSSNDNSLKSFDSSNNKYSIFEGHSDFIMSIRIKDNFIVTGSKDNTVRVWIWRYSDTFECKSIAVMKGHSDSVNSVCLLLKKGHQVVSASKDQSIKIWDFSNVVNSLENLWTQEKAKVIKEALHSEVAHEEELNQVKESPNEKMIVSIAYDKVIKVWNNKLENIGDLVGHKRGVTDVSFSQYAKVLASASTDNTIKIWNLVDFTCINTFEGHLSSVLKIDWIYFGTHLVSGGADGLIKFWNIKTTECVNTINAHDNKIWALSVLNNEKTKDSTTKYQIKILSGGNDGILNVFRDVSEEAKIEELKKEEQKLIEEEELYYLRSGREYYKAMELCLKLNKKKEFMKILKEFIEVENALKDDYIDIILKNRKKLEEDMFTNKQENNNDQNRIFKNESFIKFVIANQNKIFEIIRDFNTINEFYFYAQILLKIVLQNIHFEEISSNKQSFGIKNKGFDKKNKNRNIGININENLEIIKGYAVKHNDRLNRQLTKSFLLDHILDKTKLS